MPARPNWDVIVASIKTLQKLEAFRVALLLEGKDTRSARMAITRRRDQILGLRDKPLVGGARRHRGHQ